jgi:hypothetical protein
LLYLFGFDGRADFLLSSVAAGHDNCHYDCYESQLERTLQGVFEAAGMKLIVQNAGEVRYHLHINTHSKHGY